jgi:hypothetical protein
MANPVPYGVKRVLDMTRQHRILDATAFLLEKAGDYAGAYALVHATLKEKVAAFNDAHVEWLNSEPGESSHVNRNSVWNASPHPHPHPHLSCLSSSSFPHCSRSDAFTLMPITGHIQRDICRFPHHAQLMLIFQPIALFTPRVLTTLNSTSRVACVRNGPILGLCHFALMCRMGDHLCTRMHVRLCTRTHASRETTCTRACARA